MTFHQREIRISAKPRGFHLITHDVVSSFPELAQIIKNSFDSIDNIRFVNSGTEAVFSAIRLARAYTNKNKIMTRPVWTPMHKLPIFCKYNNKNNLQNTESLADCIVNVPSSVNF